MIAIDRLAPARPPGNSLIRARAQRGALLIEHLVALAILAMVVTSVFTLLSVGYLAENLAQDQNLATNLAQRALEEVRAAGVEAAASTVRQPVDRSTFRGYDWKVDVIEVAPQLKQVTAIVYWKARGREQSVRLVTLLGDQ